MIQGTKIYKVSIANAVGDTDEKKGFLDNKKVSDYDDFDISAQPIESETLDQFKKNPTEYMNESSKIIKRVMSSLIVDGVKYENCFWTK